MKRNCIPTPTLASDLLDEKQAAEYLQIKPRTVRSWRQRGLPCFKPTAKITRFRRAELDDWLSKFRVAAISRRARRVAPASPVPRSNCKADARQGGAQ
jgi:excisionase family DNA binding protein